MSASEVTVGAESESPFSELTSEFEFESESESDAEAEAEAEAEHGGEAESESDPAYEGEAESYDESESEGEAEAALSENEWGEAEEEAEAETETDAEEEEESEDFVGRFDAFGDERDSEWELGEDEVSFEDEDTLAASGLSTAEQKAVEITSLFETGKRGGFYGLSGNFDGQGLSFGLVNWTIGTGSLQPLLRDFAREHPSRWAQVFGPHAPAFLMVITPDGKGAKSAQLTFAIEEMNTSTKVNGKLKWSIKEPWATYFKRLSEDREFQRIQVRYVRKLLKRADYFCKYLKLKSEMAFAYMFDAVSSHGKWWLTRKFAGREKRRIEIEKRLAALTAQHGEGRVPEADILLAIADVLSATSAARWAAHVRRRKRWFVTGEHPRAKELKGLEPRPNVPYLSGAVDHEHVGSQGESGHRSATEFDSGVQDEQYRGTYAARFPPTRAALGRTPTAPRTLTPQQKRWPCDANPPRCMTSAVSTGEFGIALQRFTDERCVNSKVPVLLTKSASFMARVATLDQRYLALNGAALCKLSNTSGTWWDDWAPNAKGVLTKGPFKGRRVLTMLFSQTGSLFMPSNAVDNGYGYDLIVIKLPDGIGPDGKPQSGGSAASAQVLVQWISAIAHETVHAHTFVTATSAPRATIPLRVAAAIADEAATRALEAKILNEIAATAAGASLRAAVKGVAGPTTASRVQRDFFSGQDRLTYLEHFVLTERMLDAIVREKLKRTDLTRIDKEIDAIDLTLRPLDKNLTDPFPTYYDPGAPAGKARGGAISSEALFKTIATEYGKFRFWRRVMAARWQALETRLGRMPAPADPAREKVAQEHVKAFFGGLVRYDALPATAPKQKNESDEAEIAGESEIADDAKMILGKWTVRLKDWVWEYEFSPGGKVTWRDTRSSEKGDGRWTVSPKAINISWTNSATTESWTRPLTPARQMGWYRSTYYTGPYQPLPAWADAIDLFPASVTLGLDRSNASMTTAFAPVTTSSANHLCAALADVTSGGTSAPFAAHRETEMVYVGSLLKIGVMYAAFALRARVQAFADAARANGVTTAGDLFGLIKRAWTPKLKALFPGRATHSFGNNQDVTVPQVDRIFTLSATGKIEFAIASPAITLVDLDRVGEFRAPVGRFDEWMRLMMRWSNNAAASRCTLALGYFYINGLFARSGFFATGKGLWISGDYAGHDWVRTTTERSANAAGVALEPRWATAQRRTKSNFVGNAFQIGRLMTAMAQDKLVDAGSCDEMRKLANQLAGGIGSYAGSALAAAGRTPTALSSKIGFGDDSFSHDCAIVERTVGGKRLRYAAVVLGSAPAQRRRGLSDLFLLLDAAVVARNP